MPIQIICPGCHKRFQVSEKFAGKSGPCPGCKTLIQIPSKEEEVVIHAPESFGPKGASGEAVLKPIKRKEDRMSPVLIGAAVGAVVVVLAAALLLRTMNLQSGENVVQRRVILSLGAVALAPPLVLAGYSFLRNDELEPYRGTALYLRAGICAAVYAGLWGVHWYICSMLLGPGQSPAMPQMVFILPILIVAGAVTSLASLDLEALNAAMHYGFYLAVTVVLRLIVGLSPF